MSIKTIVTDEGVQQVPSLHPSLEVRTTLNLSGSDVSAKSLSVTGNISGSILRGNALTIQQGCTSWTSQGGGWQTVDGNPNARRATGATVPVWTQMDGSSFWAYKMEIGDIMWFTFRFPHGYSSGTDVYFNVHWTHDEPSLRTVHWHIDNTYAKGYGRGVFNMTPLTSSMTSTPSASAWTHMTSEDEAPIINSLFEADGYLQTQFIRITNGATDYTGSVFILGCSMEYQSLSPTTQNREYPYTTIP